MAQDQYYIGTDLKFLLTITGEGFDMTTDNYDVSFICGDDHQDYTQDDVVDGYLIVDSTKFKTGTLRVVVTAYVPDEDFQETGVRREVMSRVLCQLKRP